MKHLNLFSSLSIAFLLLSTSAYPFESRIAQFNHYKYDKEIVCNWGSRYVITYHHRVGYSGVVHYFVVQDMKTNTVKMIPMDAYYTSGYSLHHTDITINDMEVTTLGECWFCGQKTTEPGGNPIISSTLPTTTNIGIVGHFSIYDVLSGSGSYEIIHINGTQNLTKIEPRGNYAQVFMIGIPEDSMVDFNGVPFSTCIVGLDPFGSHKYDIAHSTNAYEIFSDLTDMGAGVVFVSYNALDHNHIGLRHVKNGPISEFVYLSMLSNCNEYDIGTATTIPPSSAVLWREYYDPVLLSSTYMSHACSNGTYGIATYRLQVSNMGDARISEARLISSNSYCSLKDCRASSYSGAITYLLTEDATLDKFFLHEINWGSNVFGTIYSSRCCNRSSYIWESLTDYDSSSTYHYIAGHAQNGKPAYFAYRPVTLMLGTCMQHTSHNLIELTTPSYSPGNSIFIDTSYKEVTPLTIYTGSFVSTTLNPHNLCQY